MAHLLRRAMSAIRYRREQGGMATVSDKSHQEASEGRVMNTPVFSDIELQIREEKLLRKNGTRRENGLWRSNDIAPRWSDRESTIFRKGRAWTMRRNTPTI